jgi:hypothetical protein
VNVSYYALNHLDAWMASERAHTPRWFSNPATFAFAATRSV